MPKPKTVGKNMDCLGGLKEKLESNTANITEPKITMSVSFSTTGFTDKYTLDEELAAAVEHDLKTAATEQFSATETPLERDAEALLATATSVEPPVDTLASKTPVVKKAKPTKPRTPTKKRKRYTLPDLPESMKLSVMKWYENPANEAQFEPQLEQQVLPQAEVVTSPEVPDWDEQPDVSLQADEIRPVSTGILATLKQRIFNAVVG
jgi:hypothetical protein